MSIRLVISLILVLSSFLSFAQDDYYEEEPPVQENFDAYDTPVPPQDIQNKMEKPLPADAYEGDSYTGEPIQKEIEPYSENVDPYPQTEPYPDEPYPENTDAGNYDDSY